MSIIAYVNNSHIDFAKMKKIAKNYFRQSIEALGFATLELFVRSQTFSIILIAASLLNVLFIISGIADRWIFSFMVVITLLICRILYRARIRAEKFGDRIDAIEKSKSWIKRHDYRLERSRFNATVQSRNQAVVDKLDRP